MNRRGFLQLIGIAATNPSVVIPKKHVVFHSYRSYSEFGGGSCVSLYRPEDYDAVDLSVRTTEHDRFHSKTELLADGKPVKEFVYFKGEESFSVTEAK